MREKTDITSHFQINEVSYFVEPQNVRNFPYPVRIRWIKLSNLATFIYITGYLNVRKMSERLLFRTFIGALDWQSCYLIENYAGGIFILGMTGHSINCLLICRGRLMTRLACNGPLAPGSWPWVPKTTPPGSTPSKGSKTSRSTAWEDTANPLSEYFSTRTSVCTL